MDFPSIKSLHGGVVALPDRVMPSQPHFSHSPSYDSRESQHVYHPAQPYAPHPGAAPLGAAANSPSSHDIPSQTFIHPPAKPFARTQRSFDSGAPGNGVFMAHHSDRIEGPLHEAMTAHHPPNDLTESMGNEARPLHVPPGLSRELAPGKRVVDESMQKSHQTQTQVSPLMSVERPPPGSVDSGTIPRPKRHAHGPPAWAIRAAPQRIVCVKRDGRASMDPSISRALDGDGSSKQVGRPSPTIVPRLTNGHPESSWDCSITGDRPYDEVTRELCDFLHAFVVANDGWRSLEGVKLEIEAKIGMLFDDVTKTRLALPVRTETVVDRAAVDVRFKSSITLEHHKTMNLFLNDAFNRSQASGRSPMTYKHTKERDSFYDFVPEKHFQYLPACAQNILPASAAANQGRPPRIRLTRDENGKELHKIIKHRVEDLDIFSPRTEFDYRISINLEFPFEGDTSLLVDSYEHGKPKKGRSKDRVTYWHQSYRLDFTQAKASEDQSANAHDCSHELEIELDEEKLYMAGKNDRPAFEQYVEGLVNNLRVLGRVGRDIPGGVS